MKAQGKEHRHQNISDRLNLGCQIPYTPQFTARIHSYSFLAFAKMPSFLAFKKTSFLAFEK